MQTHEVLAYLKQRKSKGLTPLDALDKIGTFRLGARIFDLRKAGHEIITEWESKNGKRYARYVLIKEAA